MGDVAILIKTKKNPVEKILEISQIQYTIASVSKF